jgi:glucokinase
VSARGGIDLGGTKVQVVVVNDRNQVLGQARRPTPTSGGPKAVTGALAEGLAAASEDAGLETSDLAGVGVGSPGEIDARKGTVSQAKNLPDWAGSYRLAAELRKAVDAPVKLGNDVDVATTAEFELGAGKPYRSLLGVFWGTGVGGGLVLDGKRWTGRGAAGEIGHMVIKRGGARCPCGRRGCMEAYAGRSAMEARARKAVEKGAKTKLFTIMEERGRDRLTSGIWWRAIRDGDELATELIERAVKALGAGIASAVNLLDVEAVVIGGGLGVRFGDEYVARIEEAMGPHLFVSDRPPKVQVAKLGDLGGAIGAALLIQNGPGRARSARNASARSGATARKAPQAT